MCYCTIALVTDYDCWHEGEEPVTVDMVVSYLKKNAANAQKLVAAAIAAMPATYSCVCHEALRFAILTDAALVSTEARTHLELILGKYLGK
jgi:5'-methylthioadenosine phosphorylase